VGSKWPLAVLVLALTVGRAGKTAEPTQLAKDLQAAVNDPDDTATLERALGDLPQFSYKDDEGIVHTYYVYEGDMLQTREQIRDAFRTVRNQRSGTVGPYLRSGELLVNTVNGKATIWPIGSRHLTYAVDRNSFPSATAYDQIVTNMDAAAQDWVAACTECGISFEHLVKLDVGPAFGQAVFVVRFASGTSDDFFAYSFFPNSLPSQRLLLVTASYFTTGLNHVGILRHELGHILGYRHEQIQGVAGCATEQGTWKSLTPYDAKSVMHYLCGNGGTYTLTLTDFDKSGHASAYKP
jgi:hypothetical protein